MSERNTVVRSLHDLGLRMWFDGSLAGAVGFNGAAADAVRHPAQRHPRSTVPTAHGGAADGVGGPVCGAGGVIE
jgi:hypothetical protein